MKRKLLSPLFICLLISCLFTSSNDSADVNDSMKKEKLESLSKRLQSGSLKTAYFASGCFWCVEAIYESIRGVEEVISGYSGGEEKNPGYNQVSMGITSHAEAVEVIYDPKIVSFEILIRAYYASQNPTTVNGQHPDFGSQYRSIIFYQSPQEKKMIEDYISKLNKSQEYDLPIATEVLPYKKFWKAEEYHQDFEKRNPSHPYVKGVSIPRLRKFQAKFKEYLK
ncbi:peptide-methionine (S)-S-oxide reductase MsrA [Leptospira sp. GIMC2001]|uniref:peptide-methionine (S)-S-oxide reductase MsrA n=1 Tax=Leptospira sp. GIMC2001 TaxID=1513297 RepID=UPI00234B75CC|nr:peptide-methionine (S)-S-oxide reductase MsrA [Leptospira sp. GIMC2001]WCL50909.1 peptide-methionine (S)-S-oxide reductase MsrA [Leptospira sp. GIMC2001]